MTRKETMLHSELTRIVGKIPGGIDGNDDEPPSWLRLVDGAGAVPWDICSLKALYDAARSAALDVGEKEGDGASRRR